MTAVVVRVWLPDRPGALGQVASRIGGVRGEIVGIEILERGGDTAIDELVVDLPDAGLIALLVEEIRQVDGVDVEEVRELATDGYDPTTERLEAAARVLAAPDRARAQLLADETHRAFGAEWAAVVEPLVPEVVAHAGTPPDPAWVLAFAAGATTDTELPVGGAGDVVWARLVPTPALVTAGRPGVVFRGRERRQLAALAEIAGRAAGP